MGASRTPVSWNEVVVVCGARRWDGNRPSIHRVAVGLGRHVPVLYVEPVRPVERTRTDGPAVPLQLVDPTLAELAPRVPTVGPWLGGGPIAASFARRALRQALVDLGSPRVRAMIVASFDPSSGSCDEELRVFYAGDDFLAGSALAGRGAHRFERELQRNLAAIDLVVAASPLLADVFRAAGAEVIVLPNGCDDVVVPDDQRSTRGRRPVAGFVGELSNEVDLLVLDAVADRGLDVLVVGRGPVGPVGSELRTLLRLPNVEWVGPRSSDTIGPYLAGIDVGLAPFIDTPHERACPPLDLLGHLAVGSPVVGTDCEVMRWLRSSAAPPLDLDEDLAIGSTPEDVADLVEERLARPVDPAAVDRRRSFAQRHHWSARCAELAGHLGLDDTVDPLARTEEVS